MEELMHSPEKWIKKYVKDVSLKPIHNDNPVKVSDIDSNVVFKPYNEKAKETKRVGA